MGTLQLTADARHTPSTVASMEFHELVQVAAELAQSGEQVVIVGVTGSGADELAHELGALGVEVCDHLHGHFPAQPCAPICQVRRGSTSTDLTMRLALPRALERVPATLRPSSVHVVECNYDLNLRRHVGTVLTESVPQLV